MRVLMISVSVDQTLVHYILASVMPQFVEKSCAVAFIRWTNT